MANEGINRLARALDGRSKKHGQKPPLLDFGAIQTNRSLKINSFPRSIPFGDYVSCIGIPEIITSPIRVLVCWVGDDATVIQKIFISEG